jgi:hypothetical protein
MSIDWNPYLLLVAGIAVGFALGGVVWFVWLKFRSQSSHGGSDIDAIASDESLQHRLEELTILHAIAIAGAEATDEDVLIERVTQIIGETLFPNNFGLLLMDETGEKLQTHPSYRELDKSKGPEWLPVGAGISGQVALTGKPMRVADASRH